ncbi:MAG: O-antigen ligase family protein [Phreatobacter sp.]|uniref:O-antigen ligase family protein n=1 Tax=Phreatobacter sp. TaxID=1966341 RepID=UPI001A3DEF1C|nr:O-antigen ligase family protein [Phreatobacter sp.]MBL8569813.1 O-antigen ligase family protein [Phreatobacter sp.]
MIAANPARNVAAAGYGTAGWLVDREALRLRVLFLMLVGSAFVFAEPSPYEIGALVAIGCFAATGGLRLRAAFMPLVLILVVYCLGLTLSAIPVLGAKKVASWVAVSWYLAVTMVFFAIVAAENTAARMDVVVRAWTLAAVIAALAGLAGYFRAFPGAFDLLTLYGRAKGTFNDPNVFGPFLILPMLTAMQAFYAGGRVQILRAGAVFAVLLVALLLSFSRGAWIHFALSAAVMTGLLFLTAQTRADRLRILVVVTAGLVLMAALLAVLLSIDKVADLMKERASFNQSYDHGPMGRFGRHAYGWQMALDLPMGIGPLQFTRFFPEDVHNVYLNAFMSGGWTAGIAYHVLVGLTLFVGLLAAFRRTPWQPAAIAVFATFCGLAFEGKIIDTDHWRHFWALGGLLWGLAVAGGLQPPPKRPKSPGTVGV